MPQFILDTAGVVTMPAPGNPGSVGPLAYLMFSDLDAFTAGYIEALFFTSDAPGVTTEEWQATEEHDEGSIPGDVGFSDLAPEALAKIIEDCRKFQLAQNRTLHPANVSHPEMDQAGRDFWYTRNEHGCGFWDGDWPEPYASQLTDAAKAFGNVDAYLGDDGKVYLS
jgi:hypothetical protein